jgi:hypothetical protein
LASISMSLPGRRCSPCILTPLRLNVIQVNRNIALLVCSPPSPSSRSCAARFGVAHQSRLMCSPAEADSALPESGVGLPPPGGFVPLSTSSRRLPPRRISSTNEEESSAKKEAIQSWESELFPTIDRRYGISVGPKDIQITTYKNNINNNDIQKKNNHLKNTDKEETETKMEKENNNQTSTHNQKDKHDGIIDEEAHTKIKVENKEGTHGIENVQQKDQQPENNYQQQDSWKRSFLLRLQQSVMYPRYFRQLANLTQLRTDQRPDTASSWQRRYPKIIAAIKTQKAQIVAENAHFLTDTQSAVFLDLSGLVLASYRVLIEEEPFLNDRENVVALIRESLIFQGAAITKAVMATAAASPQPIPIISAALQKCAKVAGESFRTEFEQDKDDLIFTMKVRKCFFNSFFKANGMPFLTSVFCAWDINWVDALRAQTKVGLEFRRPQLLPWGDPMCKFEFTRVEKTKDPSLMPCF